MGTVYGNSETLRNYSRGFMQSMIPSLANFIAPLVVTGVASGQYKTFEDKNSFQTPAARRAIGGKATRIVFESDDAFYNCRPNALETTIDEHERKLAGNDQGMLEQSKIQTRLTVGQLSHEIEVFTAIRAAVAATGGVGVWSNDANDPIAELDAQILSIALATGRMPNAMVIGLSAFNTLRHHVLVKARLAGVSADGVTLAALASMLINPQIEIRVGVLAYDTAKPGKTKSNSFVVGNEVLVFTRSENPTPYDPSFAKTFSCSAANIFDVRLYQEDPRLDVVAVDWSDDAKVTASPCGRRMAIT